MKKELKVPKFNARSARYPLSEAERRKNESEEFEFWAKLDLNDYFDEQDFVPAVFPNLKPSTSSISIRLPDYLLSHIKESANQQDVPYQSLIKQTLLRHFAPS